MIPTFEEWKSGLANALGVGEEDLVSNIELIILNKNYYAENSGGHVAFWDDFIEWLDKDFRLTRDIPMSRLAEKKLIVESLNGYDSTLMTIDEHTRLYADLMMVFNGSAATLAINRIKGGRASRKLTPEITKAVRERFEELKKTHPRRFKNAHIDTLVGEFKLSKTSIKSILPKRSNAKSLT